MILSLNRVGVVALRVVRQLKRDKRTIGLITFAPILLMILFGYALSGEMSDVSLGLVDEGGHQALRSYLEGVSDFNIQYLGSQSDAEKLIYDGRLNGAVILRPGEVIVLQDETSLQIANAILASVSSGMQAETAASLKASRQALQASQASQASQSLQASQALQASQQSQAFQTSQASSQALMASQASSQSSQASQASQRLQTSTLRVRYIYGYDLEMIETVGPAILGLVVFFFTFILAAISFLRERTQGTLEKFMVSPLSRMEMVSGYVLGFSLISMIQSTTTLLIVVFVFGVPMNGNPLLAFAIVLLLGASALVLGSFFSNFAKSEFQVVQFIPIVIIPQIVLSGVFWPIQSIPEFLRPISYVLPLTYSGEALRAVMLKGASAAQIWPDLLFLSAFFILFFGAATLMLRREVG
jgi:ABC-2 type transport system permease protein